MTNFNQRRTRHGMIFLVIGVISPLLAGVATSTLDLNTASVVNAFFLIVMCIAAFGTWAYLARGNTPVIGFRTRASKADVIIAVLFGIGGLLLVPALSLLTAQVLGHTELLESTQRSPVWLVVAGVFTAAFTEEILFRAAPMELLLRRRSPRWIVVAAPLAIFVLCHVGSWNLAHVVGVVLPMGLLLSLIYLWRRSLIVNILTHFLIDAPLIVIALAGSA